MRAFPNVQVFRCSLKGKHLRGSPGGRLSIDFTEACFVQLRGSNLCQLFARDPLIHTKDYEKQRSVSCGMVTSQSLFHRANMCRHELPSPLLFCPHMGRLKL